MLHQQKNTGAFVDADNSDLSVRDLCMLSTTQPRSTPSVDDGASTATDYYGAVAASAKYPGLESLVNRQPGSNS